MASEEIRQRRFASLMELESKLENFSDEWIVGLSKPDLQATLLLADAIKITTNELKTMAKESGLNSFSVVAALLLVSWAEIKVGIDVIAEDINKDKPF